MKITIDPKSLAAIHAAFISTGHRVTISRVPESGDIDISLPVDLDESTARDIVVNAIKNWHLRDVDAWDDISLRNYTAQQVELWIDNNVNSLATAKEVLKKLAKLNLYLLRRLAEG